MGPVMRKEMGSKLGLKWDREWDLHPTLTRPSSQPWLNHFKSHPDSTTTPTLTLSSQTPPWLNHHPNLDSIISILTLTQPASKPWFYHHKSHPDFPLYHHPFWLMYSSKRYPPLPPHNNYFPSRTFGLTGTYPAKKHQKLSQETGTRVGSKTGIDNKKETDTKTGTGVVEREVRYQAWDWSGTSYEKRNGIKSGTEMGPGMGFASHPDSTIIPTLTQPFQIPPWLDHHPNLDSIISNPTLTQPPSQPWLYYLNSHTGSTSIPTLVLPSQIPPWLSTVPSSLLTYV
jgi:hypothetical protein